MNLEDSNLNFSALDRILWVWLCCLIFIVAIYWGSKRLKDRQRLKKNNIKQRSQQQVMLCDHLQRNDDGILLAYMPFHLIFSYVLALTFMCAFLWYAVFYFYKMLPAEFWIEWTKGTALTAGTFLAAISLTWLIFSSLRSQRKKLQLKISPESIYYLIPSSKGGTVLSNSYASLEFKHIDQISFRQINMNLGAIDVKAGTVTKHIMLYLPIYELSICHSEMNERFKNWKESNRSTC